MTRRLFMVGGLLLTAAHMTAGQAKKTALKQEAGKEATQAPRFRVEMLWPKPMDNKWIMGSVTGLDIDSRDHIFVLNTAEYLNARTEIGTVNPTAYGECCVPAPPVMEYDAAGDVVGHWGGPGDGYDWPTVPSGLAIDPKGNVWIGGAGPTDTRALVFSKEGKFVMAIGKAVAAPAPAAAAPGTPDTAYAGVSPGAAAAGRGGRGGRGGGRGRGRGGPPPLPPNNASMEAFGGATSITFDAGANEAYLADGSRNRRVVVVDMTSGAFKRVIGGSGETPQDAATSDKQFAPGMLCVKRAKDGMVYVCDTKNDRIQVFKSTGEFVKEQKIAADTKGGGSVWDVAFSRDAGQKYLYVADGMNEKIRILDRSTLSELTAFGDGGRVPGEFYGVRTVATDSKGNLYTGEYFEGKRVQRFNYDGTSAVRDTSEGVLWPKAPAPATKSIKSTKGGAR